ncbi:hypothetical protein M3J09_003979 [Ascochyta lentis]
MSASQLFRLEVFKVHLMNMAGYQLDFGHTDPSLLTSEYTRTDDELHDPVSDRCVSSYETKHADHSALHINLLALSAHDQCDITSSISIGSAPSTGSDFAGIMSSLS